MENTRDERMAIAKTILEQLGGNRFIAMTGAKGCSALASGLSFVLPGRFAKDGINHVQIELTPADTYRVQFNRIDRRAMSCTQVALADDIYNDNLREVFTRYTGLDTSL